MRNGNDFENWRDALDTIEDLTARSAIEYNLVTDDGRFATLSGLRVTPSMFRFTRARPC